MSRAKYSGNAPENGFPLGPISQSFHAELLNIRYPWCNLKVYARPGLKLEKANFWLGWNQKEQRFAYDRDLRKFRELHPDAAERLRQELQSLDWDFVQAAWNIIVESTEATL